MQGFNHHMLCLARDVCGMTQAELAAKLGMGQGTLSKYEAGIISPPDQVADEIAGALGFPVSFFALNEQPYGFPPFHFRRRKKLGVKALNRIVAEMNIRRMHVKKLLASYRGTEATGLIPEIDMDEYQGSSKRRPTVEDLARHLRELWGVPQGPIDNMVNLIERNGGIIVPCDFGTDLLDAMSQRIDGMPVLFFVNINAAADRVRHTLAHELGHMVLHTLAMSDDDVMEQQADEFAGAFLVPADEVRPHLRKFDLRQLSNLKQHWKVSMASLAVRADKLGLISQYQKKKIWWDLAPYRKAEPYEPPKEMPKTLHRMVSFHREKLGYSREEMASLLSLTPARYDQMYGGIPQSETRRKPDIRLVK